MFRKILITCLVVVATAACSTIHGSAPAPAVAQAPLPPDHYVVFFAPRTAQLAAEAQVIVRQAAQAAQQRKSTRIEISVPPAVPGGANIVEGRYTAIQNIISASGVDSGVYARAVLTSDAVGLPGGTDRAEIRLLK